MELGGNESVPQHLEQAFGGGPFPHQGSVTSQSQVSFECVGGWRIVDFMYRLTCSYVCLWEYRERISARAALKHPFIQKYCPSRRSLVRNQSLLPTCLPLLYLLYITPSQGHYHIKELIMCVHCSLFSLPQLHGDDSSSVTSLSLNPSVPAKTRCS